MLFWIFNLFFLATLGHADTQWTVQEAQVYIKIGYTLGTHDLKSQVVVGSLLQEGNNFESISGELVVPIREIKEGSAKLECHMKSSLGLDYEKSGFPEANVCGDNYLLPESGPNSIAFPDIRLSIKGLKKKAENEYEVDGEWNIHGVSRPTSGLIMKLSTSEQGALSEGSTKFRLEDFKIVVKKAFVISVSDEASVAWSIKFKKESSK